ncbi:RlpA-like double-psi beta-barrel-protein domain-containing protein-containing protein [Butyriboletus roseoflavus]|nr:RlpA-like double-psi beta-barrel-protein domain-containing protein-containing protein [Butyriboletus roseoflavus]
MAPLIRLLALFALALATAVLASPHVPRNAYNHAHRAIALSSDSVPSAPEISLPRRKRSLNKRCVPRPANSTTSAVPTTVPASTAPINVAPVPSLTSSPSPSPSPSSAADTTSSTSSSSYVPPTSQAPSPTPTPTPSPSPSPSPTTSSAAAPAQTSSTSTSGEPSYMTGTQAGQGTFFEVGLGACGITNTDNQNIVAVSQSLYDSYPSVLVPFLPRSAFSLSHRGYDGVNPNSNPVCGKSITASYQGKSVTVTVTDRCTGCSLTDLDFSPNAFDTLAAASVGRISINWVWA